MANMTEQEELTPFHLNNYNDIKTSMYIEASAGTGKTHNITGIVEKLINSNIPLEKILIVTYTEKAVGELRNRIREQCPDQDVDNANIFTIHSFCQKTLSEFSFSANQCSNLSLVSDNEIEDFIERWIRDVLITNSDFKSLFESAILKNTFIDNLINDFKQMISKYYLNIAGEEDNDIVSLDADSFIEIDGSVITCETAEKLAKLASNLTCIEDLFIINGFEDRWNHLKDNREAKKAEELKTDILNNINNNHIFDYNGYSFKSNTVGSEIKADLEFFKDLKNWLKIIVADTDPFSIIKFYTNQLKTLYLAWQQEKEKNKMQSYNDMLRNVREAVCEPDSILKKNLQKKYQYAIIDEFQDTNQIQWDIFRTVFMEDNEHTIIVVGDPKQSIYAFQGADVNVYKTAVKSIAKKGKGYRLSTNYRSTDEMVEACNILFQDKIISDITKEADSKTKKKTNKDTEPEEIQFFDARGMNIDPDYTISFTNSAPSHKKASAQYFDTTEEPYGWKITKPVWTAGNSQKMIDEETFAKVAAQTIIDCCSFENGKTKLQVFKKDKNGNCTQLRNVSFRDFTVLTRTSTEMPAFEKEFQKAGIPFLRYKDKNLFAGIECQHWISLFNAIGADDFTGSKRSLLSEALFTSFFGIPLDQVQDEKYDNPYNPERQKIILWQSLAQQRRWANLLQRIFEDSDIENRLSRLDKIPSLSKFRQIGNYAIEYLYKNECSIEEVSHHLARLAQSTKGVEEGDNLVAKGTDFDSVQLMTIHASKGLEFPVVIAAGGYKQKYPNIPSVYAFHEKGKAKIGFSEYAKNKMNMELDYEWQRLFYVAYTRASSLLILPYYKKWKSYSPYSFLGKNIGPLMNIANEYCKALTIPPTLDYKVLKSSVQEILNKNNEESQQQKASSTDEEELAVEEAIEKQKMNTVALSKEVPSHILYKHSYISLSKKGKKDSTEMTENGGRADKDGSGSEDKERESTAAFDSSENPVLYNTAASIAITEAPAKYPKGTKIGIALHEVFEKADFVRHGSLTSAREAEQSQEIIQLISSCLKKQTILIPENDPEKWISYTSSLLWKTLNAKFPEITGSTQTGNFFSLKEIDSEHRISEAEYNMNADSDAATVGSALKNYCNGFIDLVFMRQINGKEVYSILDWKSNTFTKEGYSDYVSLKKETDKDYSIQRVLYSYSLIRWLKIFYKDESEAEIFENHFGGIYYVYIRGCTPGSSSGIYARTWKSWAELEKAYKKIFKELITKKQ